MKGRQFVFTIVFGAVILSASQIALADEYPPAHMCFKPEPPLFLASQRHQERYFEDAQHFENCMKAFINEQHEAIRMHQAAAKQSNAEWEKFRQEK